MQQTVKKSIAIALAAAAMAATLTGCQGVHLDMNGKRIIGTGEYALDVPDSEDSSTESKHDSVTEDKQITVPNNVVSSENKANTESNSTTDTTDSVQYYDDDEDIPTIHIEGNGSSLSEDVISSSESNTQRASTDAARYGDIVSMTYIGKIDGVICSDATGSDCYVSVGTDTPHDGLSETLLGRKAGDSYKVAIEYPADYWCIPMRGQKVVFDVTVNEVFPQDDEWRAPYIEAAREKGIDAR